jgi:hypothetical protein
MDLDDGEEDECFASSLSFLGGRLPEIEGEVEEEWGRDGAAAGGGMRVTVAGGAGHETGRELATVVKDGRSSEAAAQFR